jgi:hypothetical protein
VTAVKTARAKVKMVKARAKARVKAFLDGTGPKVRA